MRILLASSHAYPANGLHGSGLHPTALPSGSGQHIHDLLASGLAQLGHEVFYWLKGGQTEPLPDNINFVSGDLPSVDIVHGFDPVMVADCMPQHDPYVVTCHVGQHFYGALKDRAPRVADNWIFVSRTQAESYGSKRFVHNGINPDSFQYLEKKEDYFLFMSSMNQFKTKGLNLALGLSREMQFQLIVAGTATNAEVVQQVSELCAAHGARYVGDVRGEKKARLLAQAKALIFPTQHQECCPLVIAESLISGTPVIVSDDLACMEMTTPEVGFVCAVEQDYRDAVSRINSISTRKCRDYAIENYHYIRMAKDYLREYEAQLAL